MRLLLPFLSIIYTLSLALLPSLSLASELMVYSSRNASYIKPLLNEYALETGVAVNYLVSPAPTLISRIQNEVESSQTDIKKADVMIASGAEHFWSASEKGLLAPIQSNVISRNIPSHLRSPKNEWIGLATRARTLVYNPTKVKASELRRYTDLATAKWKGRLCLLTSQSFYTQALVAMLVKRQGEDGVSSMLSGWKENLAVAPLAEDAQVLEAVNQGICDVGIVNSYYFVRFKRHFPDSKLKIFWPDQAGEGVHINITGAAVIANAPHKTQAIDFVEWLTTKQPQLMYAKLSMEYPANSAVYPARELAKLGQFKEDRDNLVHLGRYLNSARNLMNNAGYH